MLTAHYRSTTSFLKKTKSALKPRDRLWRHEWSRDGRASLRSPFNWPERYLLTTAEVIVMKHNASDCSRQQSQVNVRAICELIIQRCVNALVSTRMLDESSQTTSPAMLVLFSPVFVWTYPTAPSTGSSLEEEEVMRVFFTFCRRMLSSQCNIKTTNKTD